MTATRIALGLIAIVFVAAEIARPTHVPAKKFAARALIVHSQSALTDPGVYGSLDRNLLDDLPRIHPDAAGEVKCREQRDGSFRLFGTFYGEDEGAAVFVISDGLRLGSEPTIYGRATEPHSFKIEIPANDLGPGAHRLHVALVSSDQRGFFLLPRAIALAVGGARHDVPREREDATCLLERELGIAHL